MGSNLGVTCAYSSISCFPQQILTPQMRTKASLCVVAVQKLDMATSTTSHTLNLPTIQSDVIAAPVASSARLVSRSRVSDMILRGGKNALYHDPLLLAAEKADSEEASATRKRFWRSRCTIWTACNCASSHKSRSCTCTLVAYMHARACIHASWSKVILLCYLCLLWRL